MRTKFDIKSMLLGAIIGVSAFAILGAAPAPDEPARAGRFQISSGESGAFVVDTATGRVWGSHNKLGEFYGPKLNQPKE